MRWRLRTPGSRKRVGLIGFFGWGNYGDELFVSAFEEHLGTALDLRVLPDKTTKPYFSRPLRLVLRTVDAILIGGGDLVVPWRKGPLYWNPRYLKLPVYIAGIGVAHRQDAEPNPAVLKDLQAFFQHPNVRYISARDETSAVWIERHLKPHVPVLRVPDIVCSLTLPPVTPREDVFGIITRFRAGHETDYPILTEVAERMQERGFEVRHIILSTGETRLRDLADAEALKVPNKVVVSSDNLDDLSRALGECRLIASMKFHGTVVATMYGVPSITIMPTAKSVRYLRALDRPELVSHFQKEELRDIVLSVPDRINEEVRQRVRRDSVAAMENLRDRIASDR